MATDGLIEMTSNVYGVLTASTMIEATKGGKTSPALPKISGIVNIVARCGPNGLRLSGRAFQRSAPTALCTPDMGMSLGGESPL
jgi:hypothetical protein